MKKISIATVLSVLLFLTTTSAYPLSYQFDFNGDKSWDTEWRLPEIGDTVQLDIWLDGYSCAPHDELFGVQLYLQYDPDTISVNEPYPSDNDNGGPFDQSFSGFAEEEEGVYFITISNFSYVTVSSGRILLGSAELERLTEDETTIKAANSLGFGGYDDGFLSDCDLKNLYPAEATAEIKEGTSVTTAPPNVSPGLTLVIGNGSGLPGSQNVPVQIMLENRNNQVRGLELEVCDEDDYLIIDSCETTDRSDTLNCSTNEHADGCVKVLLFSTSGGLIEEGAGPVLTLNFNVSENAPQQECRDLTPEDVIIADPIKGSLQSTSEPGSFCFAGSPSTVPTTTTPPTTTSPPTTTVPPTTTPTTITTTITVNSLCFVEQLYGQSSHEAELLRFVRDYMLATTAQGREIIKLYYMWSPLIVMMMREDEKFHQLVRDTFDDMLQLIIKEAQ